MPRILVVEDEAHLADGLQFAEVLETYPQLTRDDIAAALAYAAEVLHHKRFPR